MRSSRVHAFTLLEVLLAIALIGLLAAMVWPNFRSSVENEQLRESAARFRSLVAMCRAQAMNEARRYRIRFYEDGTIRVLRQLDAVYAPHVYVKVRAYWTRAPVLLERVWVESVQPMPDGPPPFEVEDELIPFEDVLPEPTAVTELEAPFDLDFEPDGHSTSAAWVLRDMSGRGVRMTLDGRLGRVTLEPVDPLDAQEVARPEPVEHPEDEQDVSEAELLSEYLP